MASKFLLFAAIFIAATIMATAPVGQAQLLGLIRINGTLLCSTGVTTGSTSAAAFPNALVQLQCGGQTVASAITNSNGLFTMILDPVTTLLSSLLSSNCNLVVNTPLSTCNASLPTGGVLTSPLTLVSKVISGLLSIVNIIPTGFALIQ